MFWSWPIAACSGDVGVAAAGCNLCPDVVFWRVGSFNINRNGAELLSKFNGERRLSEIVNLKWNQVSLKEKIIRVLNTKDFTTKGKIERVIPCNEKVLSILSSRLPKVVDIHNDNYIFLKNGIKFKPDYISKHFKKATREAVKEIGINPKFHWHDLRHSFASNLVKN